MFWVLSYKVVDDYISRRAPLREAHLALANEAERRGELVLAGALDDPVDGAVLVFRADDVAVVEDFVANDPYVKHDLITSWQIRKWNVVAGTAAPTAE